MLILIPILFCSLAVQSASIESQSIDLRIINGLPVEVAGRPFQVAVYTGCSPTCRLCGGTVIASNKILTAANCVYGKTARPMLVYAGSVYRSYGGEIRHVKNISVHPNFDPVTFDYDVAVLTINQGLLLGGKISSIPLWSMSHFNNRLPTIVSGWGSRSSASTVLEDRLRSGEVRAFNSTTCIQDFGITSLTSTQLCAGIEWGNKDACFGDEGGPLTNKAGTTLLGIVSKPTEGCGLAGKPHIYTWVFPVRDWILSQ
uniref:CSON003490 protein n=1 Tax=Culicoides sonorensis TaxID=179676 RepID=A0A336K7M6_CULSO